ATGIYSLSLHDALPIFTVRFSPGATWCRVSAAGEAASANVASSVDGGASTSRRSEARRAPIWFSTALARTVERVRFSRIEKARRSEEHTSELQSREKLV